MSSPYRDSNVASTTVVRTFSENIDPSELVWHRDREDRLVTVLNENGTDWLVQLDNEIVNKVISRLLQETQVSKFNNWVYPSKQQLKQEFRIEHELKGKKFWDSENEFLTAVNNARTAKISVAEDLKIGNRSRTRSKSELVDLISGYRSYPKYRNEDTVEAIYQGFQENASMDMPIVVEFPNGSRYIFSGNTRMDIAQQLGIEPVVLLVRSAYQEY